MLRGVSMASEKAVRRVRVLQSALSHRQHGLRLYTTAGGDGKVVSIGDVSTQIKSSQAPELVPKKYMSERAPQSVMRHLRWVMQKDALGQDVFLIGPPGPLRRNIAMMYLELTNREVEYVSLSRDTTESDLKQRREIKSGSAFYIDQCAVKAATQGRVLILEGIEKAERNVLPVLNNLLENREMQLDDGRFLMSADRYDKLLKEHTQAELDEWKIVRVDESFRVIALGLPVPRYRGNPLDPPLRSRFQARDINPLPFKDHLELLNELGPAVPPEKLLQILSFASTMKSDEAVSLGLPDFPTDNVAALVKIMNAAPSTSPERLLQRLYPYDVMLSKEGQTAVTDALKRFELRDGDTRVGQINEVIRGTEGATIQVDTGHQVHAIQVASGTRSVAGDGKEEEVFVHTAYHDQLLADMMQSHMAADFCIIGPRGCGKSVLSRRFADLLGYHVEPIMLYQDMTARDLLQQRMTLPNGDTSWRPSPLITAATEGRLAVLDGVHRVNAGTFAVLQRLIHDRELSLFDGTRLLRRDRYDVIKEENSYTDQQMKEKGIIPIHPSFRIVALSEPPVLGGGGGPQAQWLSAELLTMFLFHNMRPLSRVEETHVLNSLVPNMANMQPLLDLTHRLRDSHDTNLKSVASSFSTRQLFRIAKRLSVYPEENIYDTVQKACLGRFLPRLARTALEEELEQLGVKKAGTESVHSIETLDRSVTCEIKDNVLRIGNTTAPVFNPDNKMKVPDVLFYENPQHLSVMEDMLKDFLLGEHLLLVGNQGVGKNKIVDRFLYLLNRPREYLQLHRDTTVQTLTLQPTVQDGVIRYEDSPLVRAVKSGHVLMVDEADKAPTNVTCILKTLVESGEMHLADGRRVVSAHSGVPASDSVIVAHLNFRMIILANRPGFPFLGNDFFGAMGDIYSCHAVDNPDPESEMSMLRRYGPHVDEQMLRKLVLAFGDLRDMADQGLITYPYSTREVVNMVKHLERYPDEGLANVVKNVFDFDSYNKEVKETIVSTLHKHGIPVGADPRNINLAKELSLPPLEKCGRWTVADDGLKKRTGLMSLPVEDRKLRVSGSVRLTVQSFPLERVEARSLLFSEQEAYWSIPIHESSIISGVAVTKGSHRLPGKLQPDIIHVTTTAPLSLYSMDTRAQTLSCIDLYDVFPQARRASTSHPRVQVVPLAFPLHNTVIVHEERSNIILSINFETGELKRIETTTFLEEAANKVTQTFKSKQGQFKVCGTFATDPDGMLLRYKREGQNIEVLNMLEGRCHAVSVPIKIGDIHMVSRYDWLIQESDTGAKFLLSHTQENPLEFKLQPIAENDGLGMSELGSLERIAPVPLHNALLSGALQQDIESPNRVLASKGCYGAIAVGMPDLYSYEIHTCPRVPLEHTVDPSDRWSQQITNVNERMLKSTVPVVYLPECGQIVRALPVWQVPKEVFPDGVKPKGLSGYLEVSDMVNKKRRYVPLPGVINQSHYGQWFSGDSDVGIVMAGMSNDGLVTVDTGGCIRLWETSLSHLNKSMQQWRGMIGEGENEPLELEFRDSTTEPTEPKHGRVDPTGDPHVGGGQWAGGTGGANTAGLGGLGGPYRLDAGHDVTQVPDWQKEQVPQEVTRAAREMGLKAWKERLKEIKMSEFDGELYNSYFGNVKSQIKSMRVIIESLQAKGKEREWLKHQTYGDLDEAKLIEGLTGEKAIYRRRGEKEPELGTPQQKPKLVRLLVDVSGSMYRFNGYDGRLTREMEAMLMVMESFDSYEDKVKYEIIGHSGEGYKFDMVSGDKPPKNNKERLDVLKTLHAHAQFCISGDHTLEATQNAVQTITDEDADEHFVIVLSDANLDRYGIRPKRFADILTANDDVNAYVIFIGSLGNQATSLMKQMPSGRAFLCMDTKNLPQILQQIFTSTMLSTS